MPLRAPDFESGASAISPPRPRSVMQAVQAGPFALRVPAPHPFIFLGATRPPCQTCKTGPIYVFNIIKASTFPSRSIGFVNT